MYSSKWLNAEYVEKHNLTGIRTINAVEAVKINPEDKTMKLAITLSGTDKQLVLNKTNYSMIANGDEKKGLKGFGSETDNWLGKKVEVLVLPVPYAGGLIDAIRIRPAKEE